MRTQEDGTEMVRTLGRKEGGGGPTWLGEVKDIESLRCLRMIDDRLGVECSGRSDHG